MDDATRALAARDQPANRAEATPAPPAVPQPARTGTVASVTDPAPAITTRGN